MISCDLAEAASSTLRQVDVVVEMGSCWRAGGSDLGGDLVAGLLCSLWYRMVSDAAGRCIGLPGLMRQVLMRPMTCCAASTGSSWKSWPVKACVPTWLIPQECSIFKDRGTPTSRTLYGSSSAGTSGTKVPLLREMKYERRGEWEGIVVGDGENCSYPLVGSMVDRGWYGRCGVGF